MAVRGRLAIQGTLIFALEESGTWSGVDMSPGEEFIQGTLPAGVKIWLEAVVGTGAPPVFIIELLIPGIEGCAQLPGAIDNPAQSPVSSRQRRLEQAAFRVVPGQLDALSS